MEDKSSNDEQEPITHEAQQATQATHSSFPPFQSLLNESWETFTKSLLQLFVLDVIYIVGGLVVLALGIIASIPFGILTLIPLITSHKFNPAMFLSIGGVVIVIVITILLLIISGIVYRAASILIVANYKSPLSYITYVKKGIKFVPLLFLSSLIVGFIELGGLFLFFVPGILFGFAFSFVGYEIVLNNQSILNSMRRSMKMVFANFGDILLRMLFIVGIYILMSIPGSIIRQFKMAELQMVFSLISFIAQILLGWYSLAYSYTLYKHASRGFENSKGSKLLWPIIVGIIGCVVGILFLIGMSALIFAIFNSKSMKQSNQVQKVETPKVNPLSQAAITQSNELLKQMLATTDKNTVIKLNDERIQLLNDATVKDPNNAELWLTLAAAYTYATSDVTAPQKMLDAAKKATEFDTSGRSDFPYLLGQAYLNNKDYQNAVLQLEKTKRLSPENPDVYYYLGLSYEGLHIKDEALKNYNQAVDLYSKNNTTGKYDKLLLDIRKGISIIQQNP